MGKALLNYIDVIHKAVEFFAAATDLLCITVTWKNNTIDREREFGKERAQSQNKNKKYVCFQILKLAHFIFMSCDVRAV